MPIPIRDYAPFPRSPGKKTRAIPRVNWASTLGLSISLLCYAAAIALSAYPFIVDFVNSQEAAASFSEQQNAYAAEPKGDIAASIRAAEVYNEMLADCSPSSPSYESQLECSTDGAICWIEIPKIGIKEPVYKNLDDEELDSALLAGAAHVRTSSLPVGGESANTVITGHTGMQQSRMFDQLDDLEEGDAIILWTLGIPYAYEVTESELVTPDKSDIMDIQKDVDQCTLITCRNPDSAAMFPLVGSYTHRLVVHSQRTEWTPSLDSSSNAYYANDRSALFGGSLALCGAAAWTTSCLLIGIRRNWILDRITGDHALSPVALSRICGEYGLPQLRIGLFGMATLSLGRRRIRGRWSKGRIDASQISLEFRSKNGKTRRSKLCNPLESISLPPGRFDPIALDGELGIKLYGQEGYLVFRQESSSRR